MIFESIKPTKKKFFKKKRKEKKPSFHLPSSEASHKYDGKNSKIINMKLKQKNVQNKYQKNFKFT